MFGPNLKNKDKIRDEKSVDPKGSSVSMCYIIGKLKIDIKKIDSNGINIFHYAALSGSVEPPYKGHHSNMYASIKGDGYKTLEEGQRVEATVLNRKVGK